MYCVVQKVVNKKPDLHGHSKELIADSMTFGIDGVMMQTKYTYSYSSERFDRPIKDAYKISIHMSYRDNGQVKKKQWVICTMSYYELMEYSPEDCVIREKLNEKLQEMGTTEDELWNMVYKKLIPLINQIKNEFLKSEEYKAQQKHTKILSKYRKAKVEFEKKYGSDTYDYCYDVFGVLRNESYLKELERSQKQKEERANSSYSEHEQNNYNYSNNQSYSSTFTTSSYNDEDKEKLKKIYRVASKKFHPDVYGDDGSMMKLLTKLKDEWGI